MARFRGGHFILSLVAIAILGVSVQPAWAALPTPNQPILVVQNSASTDPYQNFVPELLQTEGLNGFQTAQLGDLTAGFLSSYDVVILPHLTLTSAQVTLFQGYVSAGGTLVGFRPSLQLANVFGVASLGTTLSEAWLKIDTTTAYTSALESQAMRFHGAADLYTLSGAKALATLYNNPNSPTVSPAASIYTSGSGQAILFSFDLTQSIVLTRQGNPAWAGYPNTHDGQIVMRASQMFMDINTNQYWNDLGDGALNDVPQADIQMRLFSNALVLANAAKRPLPRFWYFPSQQRALLLFTGDHHGDPVSNSTTEINTVTSYGGKFSEFLWYPFGAISNTQVNTWLGAGHAFGVHFDDTGEVDPSGNGGAALTWNGMQKVLNTGMSSFASTFPAAPKPTTTRMHWILWLSRNAAGAPDQTAQAKLLQAAGIEMDVSYTAFPYRWGYMTGSGLPMKFLDTATGTVIPVFEQTSQYEDDVQLAGPSYSLGWDVPTAQSHYQKSLSDSLSKYNTVTTMLFHPDEWNPGNAVTAGDSSGYAQAVLQYAQANSVPMVTTASWLSFWKARVATTLSMPSFASNTLAFTATGSPAGLTLLVPDASGNNKVVSTFQVDGVAQSFTTAVYQGVMYASVVLAAGTHNISVTYTPAGRILGQISPSAAAPGATIRIQGGSITETVPVAADGTYAAGPLSGGTYTVTPVSSLYTFSPASQSVTLVTADVTNINFTGTASSNFTPIRVNAAGGSYTDSLGQVWSLDTGFSGGTAGSSNHAIAGTVDDSLYQTERWGPSTYTFTVPAGSYSVTLKFAETWWTSAGQRLFNVAINGSTVLTNFDIFASGGANTAVDKTFAVNAGAGSNNLQIQFIHVSGQPDDPKIDAIEIVSTGGTQPTITTQPVSQTVTQGQTATFSVVAGGTAPLSYQWRKGGVNISGATSASYTTPATVAGDNGATFDVVVSNALGGVTSAAATLTVNATSSVTLSSVSLSPTSVTGGIASTGTVTLSGVAPAGGVVVALSSSNTAVATVPASVTVAANTATVGFTVTTQAVASVGNITITASSGGVVMNAALIVNPANTGQAKTILIFAPHPDDEALCCSAIISAAKANGDTVKIVVVTNGDFFSGVSGGLLREGESVSAMGVLGLAENNLIFLGYGDQLVQSLYDSADPNAILTSAAGQTQTYGNRGLGSVDYHRFLTGTPGSYNRATILSDFEAAIQNLQPDEIYTTSYFDIHPDHAYTYAFLVQALIALQKQGLAKVPRVHEMNVHAPCENCDGYLWPEPVFTPSQPFPVPPYLASMTPYQWNQTENVRVPASMEDPNQASNLKAQVIAQYPSQGGSDPTDWLYSFVKKNEFFWIRNFPTNLAPLAAVTISSEDTANGKPGVLAVDQRIDARAEWATLGEGAGASIRLTWPSAKTISNVVLYDRPDLTINILSGTLSFSDGSTVPVGALPTNGDGALVSFASKSVTWVQFTVNSAAGTSVGLSEFEVFGKPAGSGTNNAPQLFQGPVAGSPAITDAQTTGLSATAFDVDGGSLSYGWTADTGVITGSGSSVTFNPPVVATSAVSTITLTVSDTSGASITNRQFVTTNHGASNAISISSLALNPTSVLNGSNSVGTVTLNSPAPTGAVLTLSSNNSAATVPSVVTVAPGSSTATFTVTTSAVSSSTAVTISGTLGGQTRSASLTVNTNPSSNFAPIRVNAAGGSYTDSLGQVWSADTGFSGGTAGSSNNAIGGTVDDTLYQTERWGPSTYTFTVPAGSYSVTLKFAETWWASAGQRLFNVAINGNTVLTNFDIFASAGAANTAVDMTFAVNAGLGSNNLQIQFVHVSGQPDDPKIDAIEIVSASGTGPTITTQPANQTVTQGQTATFSVVASGTAPLSYQWRKGGANISGATSASYTTPATVAGDNGATFDVVVSNTLGGVTSNAATLTVNPPVSATLSSVSVSPTSVTGGTASTGTVTLSGAAPVGGVVVTLSDNSSAATTPASVTVTQGATTATFSVATTPVASNASVTVSAVLNSTTKTATLTVNRPALVSLSVSPTSVKGGTSSTGTVTLSGPAPSGGTSVSLSDNQTYTTVPASVTVAAGATTATFTITTTSVTSNRNSTISGALNGTTKSATLTVTP